ncbi:MAG TPA: molybdenum cofactor guanylyltransferase [Candidatus Dormibacteraeota bacterium]|nr:molybdenum cofactor guanylyltransferase [Candidatus Dormibacteraeota bacterium]
MLGLLILAGGRSARMGEDKAGLPFPGAADPALIFRVAGAVADMAGPPVIAGPRDYGSGWTLVPDDPQLTGPVAGLVAGLAASATELVLVLAADLPFPSPGLARALAARARTASWAQAVIPSRAGELEPLFAVYRASAAADLGRAARQLSRPGQGPSLRQTVAAIRHLEVSEPEWRDWDPQARSFLNCNTPAELAEAAALALAQPDQGGTW